MIAALQPDRDTARSWAQQELLGREYQAARPGPLQLALRWLRDRLAGIEAPAWIDVRIGVAIVAAVVLAVVGYVLWRSGGVHRQARPPATELFDGRDLTAAELRAAAAAAEARGDLATAVLERFRALIRALADRDLVQLAPGRTADEAARAAGEALPELAADLLAAARSFDDVRYGGLPVTADHARRLRELDERAAAARPVVAAW